MSVKVNKKSLKQQGGQAMIPEGPAMMNMPLQPQQPQVDPEVMQIAQAIKQGVEEGKDLMMIVKGLMAQELEQDLIGQALMMGGMEEEDVITIFETVNTPPEPSAPQEVDANPQLLARNKEIERRNQEEAEKAQQEEEKVDVSEMVREVGKVTEAKSGIEIKPENEGKFTAWAKKRGMGVQEAARKVLANKSKYPPSVVKMANFARNAAKWKKQEGGETVDDYYLDRDGNVDIQELDEVVVTADNRSPLQKLSDYAFVNEDDSFLTKAIKNQNNPLLQVDNLLQASSIPANLVREIIEGTTDKGDGQFNAGNILPDFYNTTILTGDDKQIPVSETLGIDNWAGALATDMALDPLSYLGAGVVRNLGTKAAKNLAPKLAKFLGNTTKNLKRAPGANQLFKDVSDDFARIDENVAINDYLKQYGKFENESVSEMLKNPEIPEYVKDELRDLQYFKSGNTPGLGPVELRKILENSGLSPDNFQEGGEKGEYVNGVFIPKESDVSKDALRNSLSRDKNIYMSNQNFSVAPLSPPPQTNVLYDFLNTASTINQELFSNEQDVFGNRKGALKDIGKRGDGKFLGLKVGEGNPDLDGPSKMDIFKATKPLYYDYEVTNMDELTSDENKQAYVNWAMSQVKDWNEATEKQKQEEQQTIQEQTGLDVSEDDAPESQTFEEWAMSQGKNPAEMSELTRQTMENLWKRTLGLKQFGGGVPFMTPGFNPYENDGDFNPYEDDFGRFLQQGMQTDYMRDTMNTVPPRSQSNDNISQADEIFGEDGVVVTADDDKEKTTDELFQEINFTPEFNVTNKVEGFVTRAGDNPYVRAATSLSKAGVDAAGFLNRIFDRRNYNRALDQLEERSGADYKYGVVMQDPFSEGFYDVNSGQLQGEAERTPGYYMSFAGSPNSYNMSAKEGGEFKPHMMYDPESGRGYEAKVPEDHERMAKMGYLHKDEMKQGGEVVELSQDMIAQLIAAGADIEIL